MPPVAGIHSQISGSFTAKAVEERLVRQSIEGFIMADNGNGEVPSDPHLPTSPSSRGAPFASSPRGQEDMPPFQDESEADALLVSVISRVISV